MTYYSLSGGKKSFSIFTRNTEATFPFISNLYNIGGSDNNVRSWKTEKGAHRFVEKNYPDWVFETNEERKVREEDYKKSKTVFA